MQQDEISREQYHVERGVVLACELPEVAGQFRAENEMVGPTLSEAFVQGGPCFGEGQGGVGFREAQPASKPAPFARERRAARLLARGHRRDRCSAHRPDQPATTPHHPSGSCPILRSAARTTRRRRRYDRRPARGHIRRRACDRGSPARAVLRTCRMDANNQLRGAVADLPRRDAARRYVREARRRKIAPAASALRRFR